MDAHPGHSKQLCPLPHHHGRIDRELKHEVRRRLTRVGSRSGRRVHCSVRGGQVTVRGHVGSRGQRDEVMKSVRRTSGVQRIRNQLKLRIGRR